MSKKEEDKSFTEKYGVSPIPTSATAQKKIIKYSHLNNKKTSPI